MEAIEALFNIALVVFIMATMASAGFNTTFSQLWSARGSRHRAQGVHISEIGAA